ncbi:MAG: hypothetical protein MI923_16420 [Phycisphaerales bacterium]|nr:hypothetical protein [Phycisphaerales bacterium]
MASEGLQHERAATERRHFARWNTEKRLSWRIHRGRRIRKSIVTERSLNSLVLETAAEDAPDVGARFYPSDGEIAMKFGFRSAVVRRMEAISDDTRKVYAEIEA